jgi:SAM-dependent methyltransferase
MRATATRLPLPDCAFAAVLLLDVLEHVDDHAALAEVYRVLRPDGIAVLSVPALRWLWSYRDIAAGHLRRYGRRQFRDTIAGAGLSILTLRYYQCLLTPFVTLGRLLGRRGPFVRDLEERPSSRLISLLMRVNLAEVRLGDTVAWPWGTSLVAVCGKAAA